MKKFILFGFIFFVPILLFFSALEVLVHKIPNSYSYKYNFIKNNGDSLQAVSMGHSQLYDGFMPEAFKLKSFNLCNSAQSFKEDYYILQQMLQYMPNLKCVILPIGYMNVAEKNRKIKNESFSERSTFYYEYMNISYDNRIPIKYRYEFLSPQRSFEKITSYYLHHIDIIGCDSVGRRSTHNLKDRQHDLGVERVLYDYTINTHNKNEMYLQAGKYLEKTISLLNSKNIKVVLISPPHYWSCFDNANKEQKEFLQEYIKSLNEKFDFQYINLEEDNRFEDKDYYNETHLSELGAEKFTIILNDSISI